MVFSVVGGHYSILGIISGPAADRFGTRPVCLFRMLAMAAARLGYRVIVLDPDAGCPAAQAIRS